MDQQFPPDEPQSRDLVFRVKRETLILGAALVFLGLAVLLAVLFPGGRSTTSTTSGTAAARGTSAPVAQLNQTATVLVAAGGTSVAGGGYPAPNGSTEGQATSPAGGTQSENINGSGAYPGPANATAEGDLANENENATAKADIATAQAAENAAESTPEQGTSAPTAAPFSPERPTAAAGVGANGAYPSPDDGLPPSGPEATDVPGRQPTSAPAVIPPTQAAATPQTQPTSPPPATAVPAATVPPADAPSPTPPPTEPPVPTRTPRPLTEADGAPAETAAPIVAAPPAAPAVNVLRGEVRWTAAQSPLILGVDQQIAPGATLIIEPGVEVRLLPGIAIYNEGAIYALGQPGNPVRFASHTGQRWDGIYGRPGSTISMENTELRGGGAGGTLINSEGGTLIMRGGRVTDNGGHIVTSGSSVEVRNMEIAGNDMPYGAAIDSSFSLGGSATIINNRIGGNRMAAGAPPVQISNQGTTPINMTVQRNLLIGQSGPNLVLSTNGPLQGELSCNTWINGTNGLSIRSQTTQVPGFALSIHDNAIEDHTPPIIPEYLKYGIGRGATSEVALDLRNNWWNNPSGPYDPTRHADGRGDSVGDNITFEPWLAARPACAPTP